MNYFFFVGLAICGLGVFQPLINGFTVNQCGLMTMAFINGLIGFIVLGALYLFAVLFPHNFYAIKPMETFHWWYILPPIIGIVPLFLAPLTFQRLGSFAGIIAILVGQIITCFIWDAYVDNQSVTITRIGGAVLAIASAYLTFKK